MRSYIVKVECDDRLLPVIEQALKGMADVAWDTASPDDLGIDDETLDELVDAAWIEVTDETGEVVA